MTEIRDTFAPEGHACRPGLLLQPTYITIHNSGNPSVGADAEAHAYLLQHGWADQYISWHYCADDHLITHSIPDNEVAWCQGDGYDGPGNRNSLSIEICENPESDLLVATNNAAELAAKKMHEYGIPLDHVVQHAHWINKGCPHLLREGKPYDWDTFLRMVQAYYDPQPAPVPTPTPAGKTVTVQPGDSFWAIAERCLGDGSRYAEIAAANGMNATDTIYTGMILRIPDDGTVPEAAPATDNAITVGCSVRVRDGAADYNGNGLAPFVYDLVYTVLELSGNRAVIGIGGAVTAAMRTDDLITV